MLNHPTISLTTEVLRPTQVEVDLSRLTANYKAIKAHVAPAAVMPILKANAYGHGLEAVARCLAPQADAFGVALVEEGAQLRDAGVPGTVLCLGGVGRHGAVEALARGLTPVLYDEGDAERVDAAAAARGEAVRVHLKVDSGMGRLGVPLPQWGWFLDRIARFRHLEVEGIFTHFAESESEDLAYTREQLRRFKGALQLAAARGFVPRVRHAANSGAVLAHPQSWLDMVRPGILSYGVGPGVKPVMRVRTQVLFVKDLPRGASVSYGRRFVTQRPSRIATLPVGYADGYPRALGGRARVLLQGRPCPQVGTICMDLTMVDVTDLPEPVESGDEAVLLGSQGEAVLRVEELAAAAGTIPYEILCGFSERVPRRAC